MMRAIATGVMICFAVFTSAPLAQSGKPLLIYVVDVEGGNATLFVAPSGESVLIDTGNGGAAAARDADRIMAAVKDASVSQIDHLITTHWHADHFGAMAELSNRIPIKQFIDHGPSVEPGSAGAEFAQKTYPAIYAKGTHVVAKPGDRVAMAGLDWRIVTSAGNTLKTPLPGAGKPNPSCSTFKRQDPDETDNAQSVGSIVTFGKFRVAHLGDLTVNKEFDLMCPANRVGTVDLFVVSHHGLDVSNSDVLVHALHPRVAIMNNGTRKGGMPAAMRVLYSSPGLEDLWQMHFSLLSGQEYTVPGVFIANTVDEPATAMPVAPMTAVPPGTPAPVHNGPAYWFKVSAQADGAFTITNARNGFTKRY
jgi:beta-lactamase superfamily II metal-dependent hydrolase